MYSIPFATNPTLDTTGQYAHLGQAGPVWFLAGTPGFTVTRTVTVPAGKALFFPVVVFESDNETCRAPDANMTVRELRAEARAAIDGATNLSVSFDGRPAGNLRAFRFESPVFALRIPDNYVCSDFDPEPAGRYAPAIADGYHVMYTPPSAGHHTLRFHAEVPSFGFVLDVTYNLTVRSGS